MAEIIEMPKLSDTMTVGTLITWLKQEGDEVANGDMLAEVETDKATMELECYEDGVLLKLYVAEGDQVPIGAPLCAVGEKGEEAPPKPEFTASEESSEEEPESEEDADGGAESGSEAVPAAGEEKKQASAGTNGSGSNGSGAATIAAPPDGKIEVYTHDDGSRIKASPLARKIALDRGIDLRGLKGTGPHGRIVRVDVESAQPGAIAGNGVASFGSVSGAPVAKDEDLPISGMRNAIARRLVESKTQLPHFYLETEIDAGPLLDMRVAFNQRFAELPPEQGGIKFTVNDLILKGVAEALRQVPAVNRSWMGKTIRQHGGVHLAFGVAVDDGLLTPVIRDAHAKTLRQIALDAKDLIGKARNKKLKPDEMSGSTFTVTNLGMFGITNFYGIINPPNAGILSVGATVNKPVVDASGAIVAQRRMQIGFSGDHRVVDGAVGAQFLQALVGILENPALMLV